LKGIRIIQDEHRSLAAVLHGMLYLVNAIRNRGMKPDFKVLGAMVYYIDAFPERYHHPKEDRYLFALLRARCPAARAVLSRLEEEHRAGAEKIRALEQALARYEHGGDAEFSNFAAAVEAYAAFHWDHMRCEEKEVLPLAEKHLTPEDWELIDNAFMGHADPLLGTESGSEFEELFKKIVTLAPQPIGLGRP
jgi:hemerythrin-like domain-containing protein